MNSALGSKKFQPQTQLKLRIQTLNGFRAWRDDLEIERRAWGREKALQLFQFFVTMQLQGVRLHRVKLLIASGQT